MPDGIFTCSHITFPVVYSFYFLFVGPRRNVFNSCWREKGEKSEDYCLLERYLCQKITFICSRISFPMVYSFYFLCFGSRRNECNSFWEELRGRGQKSTATQKVCLTAFLLALTLHLVWFILFIFCVLAPEGMNSIVFGRN